MTLEITPRALAVLKKGFETARLDPARAGVRVGLVAGAARVSFADAPEDGDAIVEFAGMRIFVAPSAAGRVVDVSEEHEQIVLR